MYLLSWRSPTIKRRNWLKIFRRWLLTYDHYTSLRYFFLFVKIWRHFVVMEFAWPNLHILFKYLSILARSTKHRWILTRLSGIQTVSFRVKGPWWLWTIHWAPCKLLITRSSSFLLLKISGCSWLRSILLLLFKVVIALVLVEGIKTAAVLSLPREFTGSLMWHLWHTIRWTW